MAYSHHHSCSLSQTLPLVLWFSLITQASSPFLFYHVASVLKPICSPLRFKVFWLAIVVMRHGDGLAIMVMIWWVSWVWFGGYWWCLDDGFDGVEIGGVGFGWGWKRGGWVVVGFGGGWERFFFYIYFFWWLPGASHRCGCDWGLLGLRRKLCVS